MLFIAGIHSLGVRGQDSMCVIIFPHPTWFNYSGSNVWHAACYPIRIAGILRLLSSIHNDGSSIVGFMFMPDRLLAMVVADMHGIFVAIYTNFIYWTTVTSCPVVFNGHRHSISHTPPTACVQGIRCRTLPKLLLRQPHHLQSMQCTHNVDTKLTDCSIYRQVPRSMTGKILSSLVDPCSYFMVVTGGKMSAV